ncbi:hypothetical protein IscW_ISCW011439, partial [Ixodes scapularis]
NFAILILFKRRVQDSCLWNPGGKMRPLATTEKRSVIPETRQHCHYRNSSVITDIPLDCGESQVTMVRHTLIRRPISFPSGEVRVAAINALHCFKNLNSAKSDNHKHH